MQLNDRIPLMLELGFDKDRIEILKNYVGLLWKSNEDLNLFSRKMTYEELIDNHIIDALLALKYFPIDVKKIADFGSGGGIPGVIYAIQFPDRQFTLFEKSARKRDFLSLCQKLAPNLTIEGEIPSQLSGFDLITARAFKPLDVILDVSRSYYKNGGKYFLLKGRREKIDDEIILSQKKYKDLELTVRALKSPILDVERHLVTRSC